MIRRPPRSTLSSSSAASDVYKRQLLESLRERQGRGGLTRRGPPGLTHGHGRVPGRFEKRGSLCHALSRGVLVERPLARRLEAIGNTIHEAHETLNLPRLGTGERLRVEVATVPVREPQHLLSLIHI